VQKDTMQRGGVITLLRRSTNFVGCRYDDAPVDFKLVVLVYKCLHGLSSTHLSEDCQLVTSDRLCHRLRSAEGEVLLSDVSPCT